MTECLTCIFILPFGNTLEIGGKKVGLHVLTSSGPGEVRGGGGGGGGTGAHGAGDLGQGSQGGITTVVMTFLFWFLDQR